MRSYWSCTKFADQLRGTPKISAGTSEEWDAWGKIARKKNIRYWLAEDALDSLQSCVNWPINCINNIRHYIDNRWISKTHALTSNLKPGQWHEFQTRLLHSVFDELVNFIEIEQSWFHLACSKEEELKKYKMSLRRRLFQMRSWRSREAGLAHLEWAAGLIHDENWNDKNDTNFEQPTPQALAAQETIALYKWWKEERPKRSDPMDASGLSEYYEKKRNLAEVQDGDSFLFSLDKNESDEDKEYFCHISDLCHKMEQEQEDEDTEMLIRIIKLRKNLWT